jgi:hypothetical protein
LDTISDTYVPILDNRLKEEAIGANPAVKTCRWRMIVARINLAWEGRKMKQLSRRGFVKATGALAAVPALAGLTATTAGAQNTSDLRVDSNIVFW